MSDHNHYCNSKITDENDFHTHLIVDGRVLPAENGGHIHILLEGKAATTSLDFIPEPWNPQGDFEDLEKFWLYGSGFDKPVGVLSDDDWEAGEVYIFPDKPIIFRCPPAEAFDIITSGLTRQRYRPHSKSRKGWKYAKRR